MIKYDFSFEDILEAAKDVVIVTKAFPLDENGPEIVYVNKAFTDLTGYTAEEAIGNTPRMLQGPDTDRETTFKIRHALMKKEAIRVIIKNYGKTGQAYWLDLSIIPLTNSKGDVTHFAAIQRDVSELKDHEIRLELLSQTDPLTELLNRRSFDEIMMKEISRFARNKMPFSLLMIDIDNFKVINDKFGHLAGDKVLNDIAQISQNIFRDVDFLARIGGEEFCFLLPATRLASAKVSAERLRKEVDEMDFQFEDESINISISIGVTQAEVDDVDPKVILGRADQALYAAKAAGRNQVKLYLVK